MPNVKVVIDCNYGDSGKGLMTDYFASQAQNGSESCVVVCSNGGSQRGHTVTTPNGIRHVFHHFGSGTFAGAETYLPEYFIVNPIRFCEEHKNLTNICYRPRVLINKDCRMSTPFDMIANQIIECSRGKNRHGSCGIGIWETVKRYHSNSFMDIYDIKRYYDTETYRDELLYIKSIYEKNLGLLGIGIPDDWKGIWNSRNLISNFIRDVEYMVENCIIVDDGSVMLQYNNVIFENAQGLCLDQNYGNDDRYTTPSNTGLSNPSEMIEMWIPDADVEVCYVTRTYLTRHGAGPFPEECDMEEINPDINDLTNIPNSFQGNLRFGKIMLDTQRQRIYDDFITAKSWWKKSLAITHLNEYPWSFPDFSAEFDKVYMSDSLTRDSIIEKRNN